MTDPESVTQDLHGLIEQLSADVAEDLLDYVNMRLDPDELTPEEEERVAQARVDFANGNYVTQEDFERRLGLSFDAPSSGCTAIMTAPASVKRDLHDLIEQLSAKEAEDLLDYVNMLLDPDELTPEEEAAVAEGRAQIARGEYITGEELRRKYKL